MSNKDFIAKLKAYGYPLDTAWVARMIVNNALEEAEKLVTTYQSRYSNVE